MKQIVFHLFFESVVGKIQSSRTVELKCGEQKGERCLLSANIISTDDLNFKEQVSELNQAWMKNRSKAEYLGVQF